jgi:universal stress protein E
MIDVCTPHPDALRFAERNVSRSVLQKILVIVNPVAVVQPCLDKAVRLAVSFGSTIELFSCEMEPPIPESWAGGTTTAQYRDLMRERRGAQLEQLAVPLRARGLNVTTCSEWHMPFEDGIAQRAIRTKADLVVLDVPRPARKAPMPASRDDWPLIRHVPAPLLLVRARPWPAHPRISIGVDPCHVAERPAELDEALVATGCSIARALAGEVELLHALRSPPHLPGETVSADTRQATHARERAVVERLAEQANVHAPTRFIENAATQGIAELVATAQADILVMGTTGRPRFPNATVGTAAEVLAKVDCDLLVVKPPGFISPLLVNDG